MYFIALRDDHDLWGVGSSVLGGRPKSWPPGSPVSCLPSCSSLVLAAAHDPFACCDRRKSLADWFDMYGPTGCYCTDGSSRCANGRCR